MKKYLFLACLFCQSHSFAQVLYNNNPVSLQDMYADLGWQNAGKDKATLKGSPMFREEWSRGKVVFSNGRVLADALLHFNLFQHRLYYQLDSLAFVFVEPVREFTLQSVDKGDTVNHVFRNGYPGVNPGSWQTYYELIADGPTFQLVMLPRKILRDYYDYGSPITKIFRLVTDYFIFNKQDYSLAGIKPKQLLSTIIPGKDVEIARLAGVKNFRFDSEKKLGDVIAQLQ